jgi:hypothetical protein
MFQTNNLLWYSQKSRSTFFQGREDDVNIMMIMTYGPTPFSFSFLENGVLRNKYNDKTNDIHIPCIYFFPFVQSFFKL